MPKKIDGKWIFTEQEIEDQIERGKRLYKEPALAGTTYTFDADTRILSIQNSDGSRIDFSVNKIQELQDASTDEIQQGYITNAGDAIHWDNLDAHYTIAGLAAEIFGTREWMRELGRKGGQSVSTAKAIAARLNGLRGGRPKKLLVSLFAQTANGSPVLPVKKQTEASATVFDLVRSSAAKDVSSRALTLSSLPEVCSLEKGSLSYA